MTITKKRAQKFVNGQTDFPYWGNYTRFMTDNECAYAERLFRAHPSGSITVSRIVWAIANPDKSTDQFIKDFG